jgi:acyl carrier protein
MINKELLKTEIKGHIIKYLNLLELTPESISDEQPLFGEGGLGLDSIDSIELIVMLEREYGIKITDPKEGRKVLVNVSTIADFIQNFKEPQVS